MAAELNFLLYCAAQLAVPLPSTRKATPRGNSARTQPVGGVPNSNVNGNSASEAPPTGDDDVARRVLLEGQVRRLKEQLDDKSKAHTSALAQVEELEARSFTLRKPSLLLLYYCFTTALLLLY